MGKTVKVSSLVSNDLLVCPRDNNKMLFNPGTGKWHCTNPECNMTARNMEVEPPVTPPRIVGVKSSSFVPKKRETRCLIGGKDVEFYLVKEDAGVQSNPVDITDYIDQATFENDGTVVVILNIPATILE